MTQVSFFKSLIEKWTYPGLDAFLPCSTNTDTAYPVCHNRARARKPAGQRVRLSVRPSARLPARPSVRLAGRPQARTSILPVDPFPTPKARNNYDDARRAGYE